MGHPSENNSFTHPSEATTNIKALLTDKENKQYKGPKAISWTALRLNWDSVLESGPLQINANGENP